MHCYSNREKAKGKENVSTVNRVILYIYFIIYFCVYNEIILYSITHNTNQFAKRGCEIEREGKRQSGVAEHLGIPKQRSSS